MSAFKPILSVILAISLTVAGVSPNGAEPDGVDIPGLVDSANVSGPAVIGGVLVNGETVAPKGTLVTLYAWPSDDDLARIEVGETVKTVPVGYALTDGQGAFELRVSDRTYLDEYRSRDGLIDLEILAQDDTTIYSYSFSANVDQVGTSHSDAKVAGPSGVRVLAVEDIAPRFEEPRFSEDGGAAEQEHPIQKACATTKRANLGNFWVTVGYGYVVGSGASMKFTYTSGASSTLGVGVSSSGNAGTYSASGTSSFSSTSAVGYPDTASFRAWKTQFRYGQYETVCISGGVISVLLFSARADGYAGGSSIQAIAGYPSTPAGYCVSNAAGTSFTKSTTGAYESSVGVSTSGTLGVNLSSKTGFSSTASLAFTFSATKLLCGTHGLPGGTPVRLVAK